MPLHLQVASNYQPNSQSAQVASKYFGDKHEKSIEIIGGTWSGWVRSVE